MERITCIVELRLGAVNLVSLGEGPEVLLDIGTPLMAKKVMCGEVVEAKPYRARPLVPSCEDAPEDADL